MVNEGVCTIIVTLAVLGYARDSEEEASSHMPTHKYLKSIHQMLAREGLYYLDIGPVLIQ